MTLLLWSFVVAEGKTRSGENSGRPTGIEQMRDWE
jgi:hypothetical protein